MGSAPSSIQSGGPGRTAAGNRAGIREFSNRELTLRAGCASDGPAEGRALLSRSPRAHLAKGASAPRPKTRGIYSALSNREPTMRPASASRTSAPRRTTRGICSALSNRELLGLEILQLVENKHHRPVLIANFEPFCAQRKQPIP